MNVLSPLKAPVQQKYLAAQPGAIPNPNTMKQPQQGLLGPTGPNGQPGLPGAAPQPAATPSQRPNYGSLSTESGYNNPYMAAPIQPAWQPRAQGAGAERGSMSAAEAALQNNRDYQNWFNGMTLHDAGNLFGVTQGANIWNQGMNASQNVADQINSGFDQYQYYSDKNADRNLKMQMLDRLLGGLGGLGGALGGGGGGGRMTGFADTNSQQAASLNGANGSYTTNITAGPIPQAQVNSALASMTPAANATATAPASAVPTGSAGAEALARQSLQAQRNTGATNKTNLDRQMAQSNADLKLGSESARARQGTDLASLLATLNRDAVNRQIAELRAQTDLYGGVINGLFSGMS